MPPRPASWLAALLLLTAIRLAIAAATPLSPDEAYYWVWSHALAPGYLDHPPMVALWIRGGTMLAGQEAFGIRLLAPFSALAGSILLWDAAERLYPGRHAGIAASAMMNATLLLGAGSVLMTPDTPLLFFWTATLWAVVRAIRADDGRWWLLAGGLGGGALLSKYTAGLLGLGLALWLLGTRDGRAWLRRWQPWAAAIIALLLFAPVIAWNAAHHWVSFAKQGGRVDDFAPARAVRFLGELLGSQAGLATPLVFALCVWGCWAAVRGAMRGESGSGLLAALTLLPAAVFVEHAFGDRVQGNWPAVIYPAACIAAGALGTNFWRPAAALGFAITAVVYAQAIAAPLSLPPRLDPTLTQLAGWPALARHVETARRQSGARFVTAEPYSVLSELAHDLPAATPVLAAGRRWRLLDLPHRPDDQAGTGLLVETNRRREPPDPALWSDATLIGRLDRTRGDIVAERYRLYRVRPQPGTTLVLLPHAASP